MKEKIIFKVETGFSIFLLSCYFCIMKYIWTSLTLESKIAFSYLLTTLRVLRKQ